MRPALRDDKGRRLYDSENVLRLQQILTWRTLGLSLPQIARLLDDPGFDRRAALLAQREEVREQIERCEALVRGIDAALAAVNDTSPKELDMETLFGGFDPRAFADEAKDRWGDTDAWAAAQARTASYSATDWTQYHKLHQALCQRIAALAADGVAPDDPRASEAARDYAALIDAWFYPCDAAHLGRLAEMYAADKRFRESFDVYGEGTAVFVIAAFRSFAENAG